MNMSDPEVARLVASLAPPPLTLTEMEIEDLTHYKRPKEQMRALQALGIPAKLRPHDNSVCVLRVNVTTPSATQAAANERPKLQSRMK